MEDNIWVFIPNRTEKMNQLWLLKTCLESLFDVEPKLWGRVIVCDDHSPLQDQMIGLLNKFKVKIMRKKTRGNYSQMVNSGIMAIKSIGGSAIITVNNDIEHKMPFLGEFDSIIKTDPLVSIIGNTLFYPDGRTQHGGVEINAENNRCNDNSRGEWIDIPKSRYCHHTTGAFSYINLRSFVFPYNEQFNFGFEDADFSLRMWEIGRRSFFTNKIHHIHHESASRGSILGPRELENALLFKDQKYDFEKINKEIEAATTSGLLE